MILRSVSNMFLGLGPVFESTAVGSEVAHEAPGRKLLAAAAQDSTFRCLEDAVQHHGYCLKAATQRLYKETEW